MFQLLGYMPVFAIWAAFTATLLSLQLLQEEAGSKLKGSMSAFRLFLGYNWFFAASPRRMFGSVVDSVAQGSTHQSFEQSGSHFFGLGRIKIVSLSCCGALESPTHHQLALQADKDTEQRWSWGRWSEYFVILFCYALDCWEGNKKLSRPYISILAKCCLQGCKSG